MDQRDLLWLWWHMRDELGLGPDDYLAPDLGERIYKCSRGQYLEHLRNERSTALLPAYKLPNIEHDLRAIRWMINEFDKCEHSALPHLPRILTEWETLIALIDIEPGTLEYKLSMLESMEADWARLRHDDQHFRWLAGASAKARCRTAWEWYARPTGAASRASASLPATPFQSYDELASFWDIADLRLGERRHDLDQIKKYWKNLQTKENQAGKKQTNVLLSTDAAAALDQLTAAWGKTKKEVFDKLLLDAVRRAPDISDSPSKPVGQKVG
ncbi:hypothetical protein [Achromobacter deleyi]|uniref:hypothetical protein n=1 Tax=Achromobacter deleyi TaxID=1353891 RepID=UPI001582AFD4|nr:hypothetical protein [Achromobacter deleyi]